MLITFQNYRSDHYYVQMTVFNSKLQELKSLIIGFLWNEKWYNFYLSYCGFEYIVING